MRRGCVGGEAVKVTFDNANMSQSQSDAMRTAYDRLGEHFDSVVIAVAWDVGDKEGNEAWTSYYKGGYVAACGLLGLARGKIAERDEDESES